MMFTIFNPVPVAIRGGLLAKPNYQFEKRQKALAKKNKQEEKRLQKLAAKTGTNDSVQDIAANPSSADAVTTAIPHSETLPEV
jgi:hypothetical protein